MAIENKEIIEKLLRGNSQGMTIQEISDQAKVSRNTVSIVLAKLEGEGKIIIREVGQAKLHYWKRKEVMKNA